MALSDEETSLLNKWLSSDLDDITIVTGEDLWKLSQASQYRSITSKFHEVPDEQGVSWTSVQRSAQMKTLYTCSVQFAISVMHKMETPRAKEVMGVITAQLVAMALKKNKDKNNNPKEPGEIEEAIRVPAAESTTTTTTTKIDDEESDAVAATGVSSPISVVARVDEERYRALACLSQVMLQLTDNDQRTRTLQLMERCMSASADPQIAPGPSVLAIEAPPVAPPRRLHLAPRNEPVTS